MLVLCFSKQITYNENMDTNMQHILFVPQVYVYVYLVIGTHLAGSSGIFLLRCWYKSGKMYPRFSPSLLEINEAGINIFSEYFS